VDFYSPDTFNFTVLDLGANGKTLTVSSVGMNSTAQNAGIEYANGPQARTIFSFQIDGLNQSIAFGPLANKTFGVAHLQSGHGAPTPGAVTDERVGADIQSPPAGLG
jgi:hypothetical protein